LTHGQRLPGELAAALADAGVRVEDIDLLAVAAGPGSFTGLRVGIATIQGIAMALQVSDVHAARKEQLVDKRIQSARAFPAPPPGLAGHRPFDVESNPHGRDSTAMTRGV